MSQRPIRTEFLISNGTMRIGSGYFWKQFKLGCSGRWRPPTLFFVTYYVCLSRVREIARRTWHLYSRGIFRTRSINIRARAQIRRIGENEIRAGLIFSASLLLRSTGAFLPRVPARCPASLILGRCDVVKPLRIQRGFAFTIKQPRMRS